MEVISYSANVRGQQKVRESVVDFRRLSRTVLVRDRTFLRSDFCGLSRKGILANVLHDTDNELSNVKRVIY